MMKTLVLVLAGALAAASAVAGKQDFTIINNTGFVVVTLNVSRSGENRWGPDLLDSEVMANNEQAEVSFDNAEDQCLWDIRVTYDDGDTGDMREVDLCEVSTVTLQ